jgi:hypothetical protein
MSRGEPRSRARKARATEFKRLLEAFGWVGQFWYAMCADGCQVHGDIEVRVASSAIADYCSLSEALTD